ncbi:MAG: molecular chaperone DnaK [Pseudonocardiales bacterium]|nr:molecular chaperone DnaK [Pseudonocardiales bacterium]
MSYSLGVDLGTTFVAAAIARPTGAEMLTLSPQSVVAPALVYLREDGTLVTGDAARRRAVSRPDRVGREFKRRLGDPTPVMLGGTSFAVTDLLGALLRDVLRQVVSLEGGPPDQVVLTHPANWGPFRRGLFEEVPTNAGLSDTLTITEPEAAAAHYASSRRLHDGQIVAVYDLGGGTFDATILRGARDGVEILGRPEGIERLGGVDFDESVLEFVNVTSGGALDGLDMTDLQTALAIARLRQDCVLAKESLSLDTEAIIPVFLPDRHFEVKLTRAEFEGMVRGPIESTTQALVRTLRSAKLEPSDLSAVLLVGGSSRIPLVARMVSDALGCKTVVDTHPKYTVALGAASIAAAAGGGSTANTQQAHEAVPVPATSAAAGTTDWQYDATSAPITAPTPIAVPAPTPPPVDGAGAPVNGAATLAGAHLAAGPPSFGGANGHAETPARHEPVPPPWAQHAAADPSGSDRSHTWKWFLAVAAAVIVLAVVLVALLRPGGTTANPEAAPAPEPAPAPPVATAPAVPPSASLPNPTVVGLIKVPAGPQSGTITPDGKLAYVASTNTHSITLIDLATNGVVGGIPIAAGPPQFVAFTPDGRFAYVSVYDEIRNTGNAVVVVDTATRAVVASIPAEKFPYAIAVSPDGRQVYIPNHDVNLVSVVNTATNTVVQKIAVKPNPHSVAYSVNGRRAYVANHASNVVTVLDTKNGAVLTEIPVGRSPHSIAMSPDRARVYVVNYDGNSVSVIDPATNKVTATIPVQLEPQSVAFAPDSRHAYVVNDGSNTVSVIDTATNQVTANVQVGQDPTSVFVAADGKHAYVTNISSNDVSVLKTAG